MNLPKHLEKKVKRYIENDKHKKLRKILRDENLDINEIVNKHGHKMIHIAAKEGARDCLEYLLDSGANANLVDKKGNLALHFAIEFCLECYSRDNERDLVSSLLTYASPQQMRQRNKEGFTPRELLVSLKKLREKKSRSSEPELNSLHRESGLKMEEDLTEEEKWRQKVAFECDQEYSDRLGRYENEEEEQFGEKQETHDEWADRIYRAFASKHRRPEPKQKPKPEVQNSSKARLGNLRPEIDTAQAEKNYRELKEKRQRLREKQKCDELFKPNNGMIGLKNMPFANYEEDSKIVEVLLQGDHMEEQKLRKRIREEIRRWHPDKFRQKLGGRLQEDEVEDILERVKRISQALNNYGK